VRGQILWSSDDGLDLQYGWDGFVVREYTSNTPSLPDIAWGSGNDQFVATWYTARSDNSQYVAVAYMWDHPDQQGQVQSTWRIAPLDWGEYPLTNDCREPAVAYDPIQDAYLIVFAYNEGNPGIRYCIYGQWLAPTDASGSIAMGSAFPIETDFGGIGHIHSLPHVIFSDHSGEMHVSYHTEDLAYEGSAHKIYVRTVHQRDVGQRLQVDSGPPGYKKTELAIANKGNGRSLIVWRQEQVPPFLDRDIFGQRVRPVVLEPTPTPTRTPTKTPTRKPTNTPISPTKTPTRRPTSTPIGPTATPRPTSTPIGVRKRIMFDESHGERNSLYWYRAHELQPEHPEWVEFGSLAEGLSDEFELVNNEQAPLTWGLLGGYDAVIFAAPEWEFSADELADIESYLSHGGGVLVIGDSWAADATESLTAPHGVTFNKYVLFAPGDNADFNVTNFAAHPALASADHFYTNYGGSLKVESPAIPLAYTPADIRRDKNKNDQYDSSDPMGSFIVAALRDSGPVRIAVTADNSFQDHGYDWRDNEDFVRSLLRWLTTDRPAYENVLMVPLVMK
jgi:hypothetical protein